jgi:PilZ domain-containing protein
MEECAERRREQRHAIIEEVFDQKTGNSIGHTADLNANGMMLVGKNKFSVGEKSRISIDVPNGNAKKTRTSLAVQCRWCTPHLDTPFYNTGFRFDYTTQFDVEYIKTLFLGLTA